MSQAQNAKSMVGQISRTLQSLANSQSINNVLVRLQIERSGLAGGGNLWVWDHYGFVAANRGVLAGDRVHLSGGGYRVHAANIAAAVG